MKPLLTNSPWSRRNFLTGAGGLGVAGLLGTFSRPAWADGHVELPFANGRRELATNFPQKGAMILPCRTGRRNRQFPMPHLPLRGHGVVPAGPHAGTVERDHQQDAHRVWCTTTDRAGRCTGDLFVATEALRTRRVSDSLVEVSHCSVHPRAYRQSLSRGQF